MAKSTRKCLCNHFDQFAWTSTVGSKIIQVVNRANILIVQTIREGSGSRCEWNERRRHGFQYGRAAVEWEAAINHPMDRRSASAVGFVLIFSGCNRCRPLGAVAASSIVRQQRKRYKGQRPCGRSCRSRTRSIQLLLQRRNSFNRRQR